MAYGIHSSADTLATSQQSVAAYGEDNAWEGVRAEMMAHNAIMRDLLNPFVEITTDRQRRYGGGGSMAMDEVDEFGRGDLQKTPAGVTVGFPLRLFDLSIGWTRKFLQNTTVDQLMAQVNDARKAHEKRVQREIKRAIYTPTNATFVDRLVDSVSLALKAFVNADSAAIPVGPNGETFTAASHTHYIYTASTAVAAADVTALVATVAEHYNTGQVVVVINSAQEAAVRALTGFVPITPTFVTPANTAAAIVAPYNRTDLNNRLIGYWGANYAEVWVKPWAVAGYLFAYMQGQPKPLALRERRAGGMDLTLAVQDESYPLRAETFESEFGVSVWNRTNGAVSYIDTGGAAAYVAPTITG